MNSTMPLVLPGDAANAGGRVVPPLLIEQEGLVDEVERPLVPVFAGEAPVLRQRLDAALCLLAAERAAGGVARKADGLSHRLVDELHPLARRVGEMDRPVQIGLGRAPPAKGLR